MPFERPLTPQIGWWCELRHTGLQAGCVRDHRGLPAVTAG